MGEDRELADRPVDIALSPPESLGEGFFNYVRYRLTLKGVAETRDIVRAGKVVAVLPLDLARGEIVLIRQFRLAAHLANGKGGLVEIVAGRVEAGEGLADAARRECREEIGVAPVKLIELFSYLTTPGLTDEEVTMFVGAVDAAAVPAAHVTADGEQIETMRVPIEDALAAAEKGRMRSGPLVIGLQWLALNRARVAELIG